MKVFVSASLARALPQPAEGLHTAGLDAKDEADGPLVAVRHALCFVR